MYVMDTGMLKTDTPLSQKMKHCMQCECLVFSINVFIMKFESSRFLTSVSHPSQPRPACMGISPPASGVQNRGQNRGHGSGLVCCHR